VIRLALAARYNPLQVRHFIQGHSKLLFHAEERGQSWIEGIFWLVRRVWPERRWFLRMRLEDPLPLADWAPDLVSPVVRKRRRHLRPY
jgi:hypothetical protein